MTPAELLAAHLAVQHACCYWDGHTTEEKYQRLRELTVQAASCGCARCGLPDHCACLHVACCVCGSKSRITPCGEHSPVQAGVEHGDGCPICMAVTS